ncbi:hypothetical protein E1B28_000459 [Marasmius oreades]|uniref:Proteophosphoglycan ppg4 n=1 Tax=Marasmius oreades TaxID=181124 RepID=A0A9P7V1B9_9AGAR|nr:uncharacterized protein E1B28_000459 [Marasmius oreades]KAG7098515.1 hypothetical protein E1B28_000459 [Marasmius oreades]
MAATLYPSAADSGPGVHSSAYSRSLMTDYEFRDGRYPSLPPHSTLKGTTRSSPVLLGTQNMTAWEKEAKEDDEYFKQRLVTADPSTTEKTSSSQEYSSPEQKLSPSSRATQSSVTPQAQAGPSSSPINQSQEQPRNAVSYSLPQGAPRRVVERYSLENSDLPQLPPQIPAEALPAPDEPTRSSAPQPQHPPELTIPSAPRHPSLPAAGIGASNPNNQNRSTSPSFMPLSASPTYNPPVSTRQRAYPQQPTFINNPTPVNPVYLPKNPLAEEVCLECAMRDQDMADVDVASPGVWDRESDIHYEELKRREAEEEATGIINTETPPRPRAYGGKLTEQNIKLWLSVNPREPTSRQQTLNTFVKSQRALLEAQATAQTKAIKEARQLDNRMRDAYSQLRRSAYDTGNSAAPADDTGGIRIKPPSTPSSPAFAPTHERTHSRDVTLLENGMIVEHVDVRKEEREVRSRQRREERRARKSSRSSVIDATSFVSTHSLVLPTSHTDNGIGLSPYSRLSQASSAPRPMSVFTGPGDRPDIPRAYSQASFSDMQSLSPSPRRSRFFGGLRGSGWLSQDSLAPSGMSGSMIDMHVALQREAERKIDVVSPADMNHNGNYWPKVELETTTSGQSSQEKKKKKGLAKIWQMVTRSKDKSRPQEASDSMPKVDDDFPLAPPPPLSYLVDRMPGERHTSSSTASLPSTVSPKFGLTASVSPVTAPSSSIPSPTSSGQSGADQDTVAPEDKQVNGKAFGVDLRQPESGRLSPKGVHSALSEPDLRGRASPRPPSSPPPPLPNNGWLTPLTLSPAFRDKSLPPLPAEAMPRPDCTSSDTRPRTVYTYDCQLPPGASPNHDFLPPSAPFRSTGARRQSFGGLTSRPRFENILSRTTNGLASRPLTANYDEFGSSRRSLGLRDLISPARNSVAVPTKRKSRFGLSSLFGKKSLVSEKDMNKESYMHSPTVYSDGPEDVLTGYAASSRHSVLSSNTGGPASGLRMSVASRKGLEDLVAQDPEFVAYRYPSQDQRLEMFTR